MADNSYIKKYCNISPLVTIYDDKLEEFREQAIDLLEVAGCSTDETKSIVRAYIAGFCRLNNYTEPSEQWLKAENARLQSLLETIYFGGLS
ncbi:head-tail connector protein [Lactococcus phage PLgW-1]|uniref:Uncharacterized protein n=3 Tax=Uwajimavirus PLgW1 TaxID=2845441 RepID=A0A2Z2P613_9CAUD|nr:head-tail connector protein [Lactococcus phage PLgW-1]ARQ94819.1 hypothetical protein PLgW1_8 [Lactococcus phage PLgW-1]ASJ79992.1 hypothetical protein [Lactococcus phage PLgY-16]ASJ80047.1 hypothetical protein [Lactococcus phage PLgY-30]